MHPLAELTISRNVSRRLVSPTELNGAARRCRADRLNARLASGRSTPLRRLALMPVRVAIASGLAGADRDLLEVVSAISAKREIEIGAGSDR